MTAPVIVAGELVAVAQGPRDRVRALVEAWLQTRRSVHTRRAYALDLTSWTGWCGRMHVDPLTARHAHVGVWLDYLAGDGEAESTRARRLAAVSSWYRWLVRERVVPYNPADLDAGERPSMHADVSPTLSLSVDQAQALQDQADLDSPRAAALVAVLACTGTRVGELLAADLEDVTLQSGHPMLPVHGKGRKRREVPLPPPAFERLQRYLEGRRDVDNLPALHAGARPRRPLFATSTGRRLDQAAVFKLLRRLCRAAGGELAQLADRMSPHVLRHSYVTDCLDAGVPLYDVQRAVGHSDSRTTAKYDHSHLDPARHPSYVRAAQLSSRRRGASGNDGQHPAQSADDRG